MAYSFKTLKVENSTAALILFFAWYVAAMVTVQVMQNNLQDALRTSASVFVSVLVFMSLMFFVSRIAKRTDIVDAAWGPAFVVAAFTAFMQNPYDLAVGLNSQTLVTILVTVWAVRLSFTITKRLLKKPEDARYVNLRKQWKGNETTNTYLRIFVVQAALVTLIASAVIHINLSEPAVLGVYALVGLWVWAIGFCFEAIGDWQLQKFLSDPKNKGKLMTQGLWRYTRHPNYFGEATMWWGIFIIALGTPYGWLGVVTPVVITYLLLYVSGVPMTEKAFEGKPGWAAYKKRTNKFFPLPPNK